MRTVPRIAKRYVICLAGLLFLLTLGVTRASADTITLSVGNSAISGYPGPYATVTVTWNSATSATITFTADSTYLMGDGSTVALNVNATSFTASGLQGDPYGAPNYGISQQVDGFGRFNFTVDTTGAFEHAVSSVTFTLTNNSGSWSSASDVLTPNEGGSTAAAHIFVPDATGSGALATGYAANGQQVPEPASIALFGSGLVGLAGLVRRRRRNK